MVKFSVYDGCRRHECEPFYDVCATITSFYGMGGGNTPMVLKQFFEPTMFDMLNLNPKEDGISQTLNAYNGTGGNNMPMVKEINEMESVVRRLTPLECERLQGYPDGWTDIGDWIDSKGKKHKGDADSPRYKALGNSIALPFWQEGLQMC